MSDCAAVLDASAVLAVLRSEPGEEVVRPLVGRAAWSAVNLCEVASKLAERGMPAPAVEEAVDALSLVVYDFDSEMGLAAADLRRLGPRGLSLGDRACLVLARRLGVPAVTADREWTRLSIDGVAVTVIR